jgi:DNA-binding winged helix-turn-helix (wHTH) protein
LETTGFRLGDWIVDPSLNRVSRGNETVQIPPRVMQVLLCLAEAGGKVVTKQELIDTVWQERYVSEAALTQSIAVLRKILGDESDLPRYVENIPRRGYRLVAIPEPLSECPRPDRPKSSLCRLCYGERDFILSVGDNTIGRAVDAEVRIDASKVSRRHSIVKVEGATAIIEDLASKNGTYVNGRRITSPQLLQDGDEITTGPAVLLFRVENLERPTETDVVI